MIVSFLQAFTARIVDRPFSESEENALIVLIGYVRTIFV